MYQGKVIRIFGKEDSVIAMYLEKCIYENVGPISNIQISFAFEENGEPKPIIFVGENGSGKSTILSNIVDAFYEIAGTTYDNARQASRNNSQQYYKAISPVQIRSGQQYMFSYLAFKGNFPCEYIFKAGNISTEDVRQKTDIKDKDIRWNDEENFKKATITKQNAENIWNSNVICYFGPDRYERPVWMGDKYYSSEEYMHPTIRQKVSGYLDNPITVRNVTQTNLSWLLDIIADSRPDVSFTQGKISIEHITPNNLFLNGQTRKNLETILSMILGEDVYFSLNFRNHNISRFRIIRKRDNSIFAPTLDSLSTGQIALFNMFSTIVRYADANDINKSIHLSGITGIVVIDEIEMHLHTKLQKEVLPQLMKLFPKIQFVITTHAPLFLLGLKEIYREEHFDIYDLPSGRKIDTEKFSEFQRAYQYLQETETYQKDAETAIVEAQKNKKPIIITEGSTDWKHLKAAFERLKSDELHHDLFTDLSFDFFEYEPAESSTEAKYKLKMGNSVLCQLCENLSKLPQPIKYIFIADRDDETTNKKMSDPETKYKKWGNNVYSLILPVPKHRIKTPEISIEHYYTDDEIKTEMIDPQSGVRYRLYMGNEFDERGIANDIDRFCEKRNKCGKSSIAIIEGSSGEKVTSINENNGINFALPKSRFAKMILEQQAPFNNFCFDSFIEIFEIIKDIITEPMDL